MTIEMTFEKLYALKLFGMAEALKEMGNPLYTDLSLEERVGILVDRETTTRENKRMKNLLIKAKFRYPDACIEDIDFKTPRGLPKEQIVSLSANGWIEKAQNIIITGPTGTGKTYIACALGMSACRRGFAASYERLPRLLQELAIARADGSYGKVLTRLARIRLLIIDDWGVASLTDRERRDLFEVLEDRYDISATIISSQVPVEKWHEMIGDPTVADAICDRLVHNAHRIAMKGESMRKTKKQTFT